MVEQARSGSIGIVWDRSGAHQLQQWLLASLMGQDTRLLPCVQRLVGEFA